MANTQRIGDSNNGGGTLTSTPNSTVYVNRKLVSVNGARGTGHPPCPIVPIHCAGAWSTSGGEPTVCINGIPVNVTGNTDTCGHSRVGGSTNVNIGR